MRTSHGLNYLNLLKVGIDELQYLQGEGHEVANFDRRARLLKGGLVVPRTPGGDLDRVWLVHDDDDNGIITVDRAVNSWEGGPGCGLFIDSEGGIWRLEQDQNLALPNDSTWYSIVAEPLLEQDEPGALSLTTGSATITGTDTRFTRYSGKTTDGYGRGTRIRIAVADSANGNEGTYEIDEVISDTEMTLTEVIPGTSETISRFYVAGVFESGTPTDPDIHTFQRVQIRRVDRTREAPAGAVVLADVMRNNLNVPKVAIIDRRAGGLARWIPVESVGMMPKMDLELDLSTLAAALFQRVVYVPGGTSAQACSLAGGGEPGILLAAIEENPALKIISYDPVEDAWTTGATAETNGAHPCLVELPIQSGYTHALLFIQADSLYYRLSDDYGATWGAATLILDPTANDPADTVGWVSGLILENGRLLAVLSYYDDSAHGGLKVLVAVYSDDYGATWETNGGEGFPVATLSSATGPTYYDAEHPALAQLPDGRIVVAATADGDQVTYRVSTDSTGIDWSGIYTSLGAINVPASAQVFQPGIWIEPVTGLVLLVYSLFDSSLNQDVYASVIRFRAGNYEDEIHTARLFREENGGSVPLTPFGISVYQGGNGLLNLSYRFKNGGKIEIRHTRIDPNLIRFEPRYPVNG